MMSSGDEQVPLTKEEKKRRKAEKKERKKERKSAKKRKRDSAASPDGGGASGNVNGNGSSHPKSNRARANSVASVHTHHSVTEDTIAERIGANVLSRVSGRAGTRDNVETLPYRLKTVRSLVSLAPSSLSDVKGNIRRLSCQDVTRYVKGLGGVLMAVRDVKVCGPGRVQNELPHIHYQVEADVVVFCPDVGTRLVGVVTESFPSHVGMLVDTLFNAMVPAEELRRLGYEYDMDSNQWSTERDAGTGELLPSPLPISIDDRIGFTVTKLNELNGIISLEGDDADMQGARP
jgi:DNA-directed RNA polymerase subunit E'/Rpb7